MKPAYSMSNAMPSEIIVWCKLDQSPYYMLDGKGVHDQIIDYFISHLPEYDHRFIRSNVKRALNGIKEKESVAFVGIYKTPERRKYAHYPEIPLYLNLNTVLVFRKSDARGIRPFIRNDDTVDIEKLILSKKFIIGISKGRRYSGIIDEMIGKYEDTGVFYLRSSADITTGHLKMLVKNRIDAYFDQPISVKPSAKIIGFDENDIASTPISGMRLYEPVWVVFPFSDWGDKLNRRIYEIMNKKGTIEEFAGYYGKQIDGSLKEQYGKIYRKYYLENHDIDVRKNTTPLKE